MEPGILLPRAVSASPVEPYPRSIVACPHLYEVSDSSLYLVPLTTSAVSPSHEGQLPSLTLSVSERSADSSSSLLLLPSVILTVTVFPYRLLSIRSTAWVNNSIFIYYNQSAFNSCSKQFDISQSLFFPFDKFTVCVYQVLGGIGTVIKTDVCHQLHRVKP